MTISEYAIQKEARRLARADGKQLSRMTMLERREYIEKAKASLESDGLRGLKTR
jgi:hypothetical protein